MALIWLDGFETYNDESDVNVVSSNKVSGLNSNLATFASGRYGGRSANLDTHGYWYIVNLADYYTTLIAGFAFYQQNATVPSPDLANPILGFYDGSTYQIQICLSSSNEFIVYRGGTYIYTTSGANIMPTAWYYLEAKLTVHNSAGALEIRVNERTVLNESGFDSQYSSNERITAVRSYGIRNNIGHNMDDFYICDTTGSKNNNFLGDVRIDVIRPDSAGSHTDFTPSAGSNYENVDETYGPDNDTTYNESSTLGHMDSYNLGSLTSPPSGKTIFGIKAQATVKKTDAGSIGSKVFIKSGSTESFGYTTSVPDGYVTTAIVHEDNPDDSAAWEDADVNAMEMGVKVVSPTTTTT